MRTAAALLHRSAGPLCRLAAVRLALTRSALWLPACPHPLPLAAGARHADHRRAGGGQARPLRRRHRPRVLHRCAARPPQAGAVRAARRQAGARAPRPRQQLGPPRLAALPISLLLTQLARPPLPLPLPSPRLPPAGGMDMALALRTMVIPTATDDALYSYAGSRPRREWTVHLQVGAAGGQRGWGLRGACGGPGRSGGGWRCIAWRSDGRRLTTCTHLHRLGARVRCRTPTPSPPSAHPRPPAGGRGPGGRLRARVGVGGDGEQERGAGARDRPGGAGLRCGGRPGAVAAPAAPAAALLALAAAGGQAQWAAARWTARRRCRPGQAWQLACAARCWRARLRAPRGMRWIVRAPRAPLYQHPPPTPRARRLSP